MSSTTKYIKIEKRDMAKIISQLSEFVDVSELTYLNAFIWEWECGVSIFITFQKINGQVLEVGLKNNYDIKPRTITIR